MSCLDVWVYSSSSPWPRRAVSVLSRCSRQIHRVDAQQFGRFQDPYGAAARRSNGIWIAVACDRDGDCTSTYCLTYSSGRHGRPASLLNSEYAFRSFAFFHLYTVPEVNWMTVCESGRHDAATAETSLVAASTAASTHRDMLLQVKTNIAVHVVSAYRHA